MLTKSEQQAVDQLTGLLALVADRDWCVRDSAVLAARERYEAKPSRINRRLAHTIARICMGDREEIVRMQAIDLLNLVGSSLDVKGILPFRVDDSPYVRASAFDAVGALAGVKSFKYLTVGLEDSSEMVRRYVYETLGQECGQRGTPLLLAHHASEKSSYARVGLLRTLIRLGYRDFVQELEVIATESTGTVKEMAQRGLLECGINQELISDPGE